MEKYTVAIVEKLIRRVEVEAESPQEAERIVSRQYANGEIVLDAEDYAYTQFEYVKYEL